MPIESVMLALRFNVVINKTKSYLKKWDFPGGLAVWTLYSQHRGPKFPSLVRELRSQTLQLRPAQPNFFLKKKQQLLTVSGGGMGTYAKDSCGGSIEEEHLAQTHSSRKAFRRKWHLC